MSVVLRVRGLNDQTSHFRRRGNNFIILSDNSIDGRKRSWPNEGTIRLFPGGTEETTKEISQGSRCLSNTPTEHPRNTSVEGNRYASPVDNVFNCVFHDVTGWKLLCVKT
jgi:hypothetical protein